MDAQRFDALARALRPANRRSLLGGAISGMLGFAALVRGHDDGDAAKRHNGNNNNNRRRRRQRNRRRTWKLVASPLTRQNVSNGDRFATSACKASINIVQRRNRFQICGDFTYATTAVANRNINVKDVIIQFGNTRSGTTAEVTFDGWSGTTTFDAGCQRIGKNLANDIRRNASDYYVNIRTNTPSHPSGAVAGTLANK